MQLGQIGKRALYARLCKRAALSLAVAGVFTVPAISRATTYTFDPLQTGTGGSDGAGAWDTMTPNWYNGASDIAWPNTGSDGALFGSGGVGGAVTVGGTGISVNAVTFNNSGYSITGAPVTLSGTSPTITNNADSTISSVLAGSIAAGTNALIKAGTGNLTLTGAETYSGNTVVNAGTLTYSGASSSTTSVAMDVGTLNQTAGVLNVNTTGNLTFSTTLNVGDNGSYGAVTQTNGNVTSVTSGGNYITIGNDGYGSYVLTNGSLTAGNSTTQQGIRVGGNQNGLASDNIASIGILTQTGGSLNSYRYLAIGTGTGAGTNFSTGVATFTGGTQYVYTGFRTNVADGANAAGVMNLGTEAGGNAVFTTGTNTAGIEMHSNAGALSATLNVDSGTIIFPGTAGIQQQNAGTAFLNLDGGVLETAASIPLITNVNSLVGTVYNGGANFNVSASGITASVQANLVAATGNGIYVPGGVIPVSGLTGNSGYIGAPVVAVTGGGGTGATAIANVSNGVITGVVITNPGQNYVTGSPVTFTFTGSTGAASSFTTSVDSDLVANNGGLTKMGPGILVLNGTESYTGATTIDAGTLSLGASNRIADTSPMILNGGEFSTAGHSETVGTLDDTAASIIDFGAANTGSILDFADSSGLAWSGTLEITDWSGLYAGGGTDQLYVGSNGSGLTSAQLADITFAGYNPGAAILSTGEVVPVPEPASLGVLAIAGVGLLKRRRRTV